MCDVESESDGNEFELYMHMHVTVCYLHILYSDHVRRALCRASLAQDTC